MQVLRVLSRKKANRRQIVPADVAALVRHLQQLQARSSPAVAAECANVLSNLCYERSNVSALIKSSGMAPLVSLLGSPSADVQASAAGAVQSICFQVEHVLAWMQLLIRLMSLNHALCPSNTPACACMRRTMLD
jgi:hypothetical protein